jgi:hypothetical protein
MLVGSQAACLPHFDVFVRMMRGASGVTGLDCHSIRELSASVTAKGSVASRGSRKSHADRPSIEDHRAYQRGRRRGQGAVGSHAQRANKHDRQGAGPDRDADASCIPLHNRVSHRWTTDAVCPLHPEKQPAGSPWKRSRGDHPTAPRQLPLGTAPVSRALTNWSERCQGRKIAEVANKLHG